MSPAFSSCSCATPPFFLTRLDCAGAARGAADAGQAAQAHPSPDRAAGGGSQTHNALPAQELHGPLRWVVGEHGRGGIPGSPPGGLLRAACACPAVWQAARRITGTAQGSNSEHMLPALLACVGSAGRSGAKEGGYIFWGAFIMAEGKLRSSRLARVTSTPGRGAYSLQVRHASWCCCS